MTRPRTIAEIATPALLVDVPVIDVWAVAARGYSEQRGKEA